MARRQIQKRWRNEARMLYATYGADKIAIRAEIQRKYGNIVTIILIIRMILFLIDLWESLGIEEPTEVPSAEELQRVEYIDDE